MKRLLIAAVVLSIAGTTPVWSQSNAVIAEKVSAARAENADRERMFKEIAAATGTDLEAGDDEVLLSPEQEGLQDLEVPMKLFREEFVLSDRFSTGRGRGRAGGDHPRLRPGQLGPDADRSPGNREVQWGLDRW